MLRTCILLTAMLVLCSLLLVTSQHRARRLFVELERSQQASRQLDVEWNQLQLEQSTWGMPARVEKIAREQLKMQLPTAARTEIVALPARTEMPR